MLKRRSSEVEIKIEIVEIIRRKGMEIRKISNEHGSNINLRNLRKKNRRN